MEGGCSLDSGTCYREWECLGPTGLHGTSPCTFYALPWYQRRGIGTSQSFLPWLQPRKPASNCICPLRAVRQAKPCPCGTLCSTTFSILGQVPFWRGVLSLGLLLRRMVVAPCFGICWDERPIISSTNQLMKNWRL